MHYYDYFIRQHKLTTTPNSKGVGNNVVTSPTSGTQYRYGNVRDSYKHDTQNNACLSLFKSYWQPTFDSPDDIINMKYFDSNTCMTYDDYAELQQKQHEAPGEATIGYATPEPRVKRSNNTRRSSLASDRSDRLSVCSDDSIYENGGEIDV